MNRQEILSKVVNSLGCENQTDIAIEEMSELTKALIKYRRYRTAAKRLDIIQEIVDVELMMEQLKLIYIDDTNDLELYNKITTDKLSRIKNLVLSIQGH